MIAHLIRLYRKEHGISLRRLSARMGVGFTVLSRFENGQSIDGENWLKILRWLLGDYKL